MRLALAPLAALCLLTVGGCNTIGVATAGNDITTSLSLACQSAEGLLGLPKAVGATGKVATAAANLNATVTKDCAKASAFVTAAQPVINEVNTGAAILLGLGVAL